MKKISFLFIALAFSGLVHAQSTPAKKELVAKVLSLQQPGIETMARALSEQAVGEINRQAAAVVQARVPAEQREAVAKDIQGYFKKYFDDTFPKVRDQAIRMGPTTIGVLLDEKFSEEELRQLVAIMESPVNRKFAQLGGAMQKALGEKLVAENRSMIEANARALESAVAKRLGIDQGAATGAAQGKTGAKPAAK